MKKHLMKFAWVLVSLGWVGAAAQSAHASQMTLQDLLNGGSITVGNMLFTNFTNFSSNAIGGLAVDPSQVYVIATMEGGKFGITFQSENQFLAGPGQFQATHFEFNVIGRDATFHGANLELTASAHTGTSEITGMLDNHVPGMSVRTTTPFGSSHSEFPSGKDRMHVSLDIRLTGGEDRESLAKLDSFSFSVDQPEPGTLTLIGIGAVGLVGYRWRRNRRTKI
jgi:hypothetical protein